MIPTTPAAPTNLADALRLSSQRAQAQPKLGVADTLSQTKNIQGILNTGTTGKVATAGEGQPAPSNIGEQMARQQTATALTQGAAEAAQTGAAQQAAGRQLEADIGFENAEFEQAQVEAQDRMLNMANEILTQYSTGQRELDYDRDRSAMDQVTQGLRLSNDKYISDLKRQGQKNRLNSALAFREALQRTVFEEEEDLFRNSITFRKAMRADGREFEAQMSQMSIDDALAISRDNAKQANTEMMYSGISGMVSGAAQIGAKYAAGSPGTAAPATDISNYQTAPANQTPNI